MVALAEKRRESVMRRDQGTSSRASSHEMTGTSFGSAPHSALPEESEAQSLRR